MPAMRRLLVVALVLGASAPAYARSEKIEPWDPAQVFPIAVRFLRIDVGVKIVEKDADDGYVLFDLDEDKRTFRGALELVKTHEGGRDSVRLVLRIDDRPDYEEQMLLDRLDVKLREELGAPKDPPRKSDGGSGSGSGSGSGTASGSGS
jgi:hypothetical protein